MILNPDRAPALTYAAAVVIVGAALLCYPLLRVWDWYGRVAFARRSRRAYLDGLFASGSGQAYREYKDGQVANGRRYRM